MSKQNAHFLKAGNAVQDALESKLFGKPCFKINGKAFCCFFEDEMVFKLPNPHHKKALALEGSKLFDPSKKRRPMKEWVQVSYEHKSKWTFLAKHAAQYISQ